MLASIFCAPKASPESEKRNAFIKWMEFYLFGAGLQNGLYPAFDSVRVLYHVTVMFVCGVCGWIMFCLKYNDLSVNTDILLHAVCVGHTLFLYIQYIRHRENLSRIVQAMQNRFAEFSDKLPFDKYHHVWDKADKLSLILLKVGSYLCLAVYANYIFNAKVFSSSRKLLYPMWVPFTLESNFNYFFCVAMQLTIFSLYSFVHVSGHGIGIGGAHFIGASFDVLGRAFMDICEPHVICKGGNKKSMTLIQEAVLEQKLKWCVDAHIILLNLTKDYKVVFEGILLEVLLSCEVLICFCGFQVFLAAETKDYQRVGMLICLISLLVFHLFLFCYPGQHIYNKSEQLRESLYLSEWLPHGPAFHKCLAIMLMHTLNPVTISYRGIIHASMPSFQHAMRSAFSYVNILMILREVR